MNKKVISKLLVSLAVFVVVSLLVAKLYDIGVHRPAVRYDFFNSNVSPWVDNVSRHNAGMNFTAESSGPFDWDNRKDIGQSSKCGEWNKEETAYAVIYYRQDKEAEGHIRARNMMTLVERERDKVFFLMDTVAVPDSLNGRKMAIYLPTDQEDCMDIVSRLSGGQLTASDDCYSYSCRRLGHFGCKTEGIVMNPKAFKEKSKDGTLMYFPTTRKEVFYYNYFSCLDYNKAAGYHQWYIDGLAEYFATDGLNNRDNLTSEQIAFITDHCRLNAEFPAKDRASEWAGASFFRFFADTYGEEMLASAVKSSLNMPMDSMLASYGLDCETLQQGWYASLNPALTVVEASVDEE